MKFICAGYPKTGSKSCSSALRKLGFRVADALETIVVQKLLGAKKKYRELERAGGKI